MAYFPTSPLDGASVTVNGILYTYNATKGAWKRAVSSINNLSVAGNITAAGNVSAGAVYTTSGLFWAGNGVAFSSFPTALDANVGTIFLGNISTQANLGTLFLGNATTQANLGTLFLGNATTQANLGSFQTFSNANAAAQATSINTINANLGSFQTFSNTNAAAQATSINTINANLGAYQIYANANIGTLFLGNSSTNANLGAFQTYVNTSVSTSTYSNANLVANLRNYATPISSTANITTTANIYAGNAIVSGNMSVGNIVAYGLTTTGATGNISGVSYIFATNYVYPNGVSILTDVGGTYSNTNVAAYLTQGATIGSGTTTANLVAAATTTSTSTTTGALVVRGGAGVAGNVFADKFYTASGIFWSGNGAAYAAGGGGGSFTASASAPVAPTLGSFWYKTTTDVLYEYINDGTTDYWIDIQTQTIAANTSGPSMYAGDVFGANITFTGTITGSVGYLIERANVVASSPPATTNLDLITAPIMYFTSNTTQNITANIRGNATVTLNSLLAIGQSSTFVIFIPNATAYYVNTIKIDNVTVTPFWQGGSSVVSGNSNSIDIYTFAVLKTANATFKVFASQVKYQNLGP
jgi:hypothetical protein